MTVPAITRFADQQQQRFAESVREELLRLDNVRQLRGILCEVPALAAPGTFTITHRLRRLPVGYQVDYCERASGETSDISIFRRTDEEISTDRIVLYSTGAFERLRVWVY